MLQREQDLRLVLLDLMLTAVIALAVAVCAYPFVRRLTERLERLQSSVDAWAQAGSRRAWPSKGKTTWPVSRPASMRRRRASGWRPN